MIESSSAVAYMAAFTLAMSNSAMNPLIYAWKNSTFRSAFINLLKCKSPDTLEPSQSMRSNLHRKSSSAQHQDTLSGAFPNYSTPPFMQRKIEPMNAMGITFEEEDEDKMSTHDSTHAAKSNNNIDNMTSANSNPVTIKIESDIQNNSIIISTTTLPAFSDDAVGITTTAAIESKPYDEEASGGSLRTGNLIVNKLMENYGYDACGDDVQKISENFLSINSIDESSKVKSKSTNSIAITKSPNKSNSHGSIFDYNYARHNKVNEKTNDSSSEGKSLNKNLFPPFSFGRKYISKSFNSTTTSVHSVENNCRKSTELNFQA